MPRFLRSVLVPAALLLGFSAMAGGAGNTGSITGTATGIKFSNFTPDDSGRRQWIAEADTARSAPAAKDEWLLERIRLTTFDKFGAKVMVLAAPAARYSDATHTASDPGLVIMDGDALHMTGHDWKWSITGENHTFSIFKSVRVVVTPVPKAAKAVPPTEIIADTLVATVTPKGKRLVFTGNVKVTRDTAVMTCSELVVIIPGTGDSLAPSSSDEPFESIDATGGVRIKNKGAVITGDSGKILPGKAGKSLYLVSGNAEFTATGENRIKVNGDAMRFDAVSRHIEVVPPADAPDGRVVAEFQPIDSDRAKNPASTARSHASGKKLDIAMEDTTGTLIFNDDVRLDDPDYPASCDKLSVTFAYDAKHPSASGKSDTGSLKHVVADGHVSLTQNDPTPGRKGRTVNSGHAEFFPEDHRVVLTVDPEAEDPDNGLTMKASRVTLKNEGGGSKEATLIAEGEKDKPLTAWFDPSRRTDAGKFKALPGVTTVQAGILVATRRGESGVFKFERGVKLSGADLEGESDHLGIEVASPPTRGAKARARIRHMEAVGHVKLVQTGYAAEAGHAEIWPHASLRELAAADANGLDGEEPAYVTLEPDASTPGVRPKLTLPPLGTPQIGDAGTLSDSGPAPAADEDKKTPTTVVADHQELIKGDRRLRAFARGNTEFAASNISGTSTTLEVLATSKKNPAKPAGKEEFSPDSIIARGGVKLLMASKNGPRAASGDTLEIFPKFDSGLLALTGSPHIDGTVDRPGFERKTVKWKYGAGPGGTRVPSYIFADETGKGATGQVRRPRIMLPSGSAPDLAQALKNLDNAP